MYRNSVYTFEIVSPISMKITHSFWAMCPLHTDIYTQREKQIHKHTHSVL